MKGRPRIFTDKERILSHREYQKKYKLTKKGQLVQFKYYCSQAKKDVSKRWRENPNNKIKRNVHNLIYRLKKKKEIISQPCEICRKANAFAHHDNYNQPLEITWLCNLHHCYLHKNLIENRR